MIDFHTFWHGFTSTLEHFVFCILRSRTLLVITAEVKVYSQCKCMLKEINRVLCTLHENKQYEIAHIPNFGKKIYITLAEKKWGVFIFLSHKIEFYKNVFMNRFFVNLPEMLQTIYSGNL